MTLLVVLGSALAAAAIWLVAHAAVGADLVVRQGDGTQPVGLFAVVVVGLLAALLNWALLAGLSRMLRRGRQVWTVTALGVFVVSLLGPLSGVDGATVGWLVLMHTAVAAVVIPGLLVTTGRRTPAGVG